MLADLKFSIRALLKTPGFTLVALVTLALGIGATVAVFSVVSATLLRPLPYAEPDRLALIYSGSRYLPNGSIARFGLSEAEYLDVQRESRSWKSLDAWIPRDANLTTDVEPARIPASFVTGGLMSSLGVAAAWGRVISAQDDEPGAAPVAVLSHDLWQRAFGGDRALVGRDVVFNGSKHLVIGVMPAGYRFPIGPQGSADVWVPLRLDPAHASNNSHELNVIGRLKPGVTLQQAQAELDSLVRYWGQTRSGHHLDPNDHPLGSTDFHGEIVRNIRPALQMLFGAVCFLLIIACVNVANLLLARAETRQREIAIRGALGAGMRRLMRQFATEGLLLSLIGTVLGLLLAQAALQATRFGSDAGFAQAADANIDWRVGLFAAATSVLTGVVFGLAPLVHVLKRSLHGAMKSAGAATTVSPVSQRFRHALIVTQLALALVLLTGTGLMLRAFWKLQQVEPGFEPRSVVTALVSLPTDIYVGESARNFWTTLRERLVTLPGVESASLSRDLPPMPTGFGWATQIEGFTPVKGGAIPFTPTDGGPVPMIDFIHNVTPGYFETLTIPLAAGRYIDTRDSTEGPPVVVINETLARAVWGDAGKALGHRLRRGSGAEWCTVVGVVADVKNNGLDQPAGTEMYYPYTQQGPNYNRLRYLYIAIRSRTPPEAVINAVRREVSAIDATLPITQVRTMDEVLSDAQSKPRFLTLVLTLFAGVALVLAAVGIYGVISYSVAQRTKEFGIRMALGAQHNKVIGLVLGRGLLLVIIGLGAGLVGALALTHFLSGFLFGITATDPATFAVVSLLLAGIAILASYIPARRATQVDPLVALREE
jgi:putative ABC transport system permease protein